MFQSIFMQINQIISGSVLWRILSSTIHLFEEDYDDIVNCKK